MKILIVDDNTQITAVLAEYAKKEGHRVITARDGVEAMELFANEAPDLLLLDVMMPRMDGFEVCRAIRKDSNTPIIMVTARGEDFERIMGLDVGADDYICKPFSPSEVMARVRAVTRRTARGDSDSARLLNLDTLTVNLEQYTATIDGKPILLTKKELELLWTLAQGRNRVFSRDQLLDSLWGYDYYGDNRTVDSHIKRLRAKLDLIPHPSWEIKTIWGVGYKLEVLV